MPARVEILRTIAGHELRSAARGRLLLCFAALFAALAVGIALAGLGASGHLLVQGFTRTAVSLLTLAVYLLPLIGLILGASTFSAEDGGTALLLAQPVGRGEIILGRITGLVGALGLVAVAGFGAAGTLVLVGAGSSGFAGYLVVAGCTTVVGWAGIALGALIGVLSRRRATAIAWALTLWLAAAVLVDLAAIAFFQLTGDGQPGPWLLALLTANPIDGVRAFGLVALGADVLLGPTGASLQRLLGPEGGALWILASLGFWILAPLGATVAIYRRADF